MTRQLMLDAMSYNAAISAFDKCKQWKGAIALLHDMAYQLLTANAISFIAAIGACEKDAHWVETFRLFQQMLHWSPIMTLGAVNCSGAITTPISACEKGRH